jgi:cold shock CspA family protein
MDNETRVVGRIIKVSDSGWGFISSRDIKFTRIFFHWTALRQDTLKFTELNTGMYVEFTPVEVQGKGYRAIHMRVVEKKKNDTPADTSTQSTDEMPEVREQVEGHAGEVTTA